DNAAGGVCQVNDLVRWVGDAADDGDAGHRVGSADGRAGAQEGGEEEDCGRGLLKMVAHDRPFKVFRDGQIAVSLLRLSCRVQNPTPRTGQFAAGPCRRATGCKPVLPTQAPIDRTSGAFSANLRGVPNKPTTCGQAAGILIDGVPDCLARGPSRSGV